MDTNESLSNKWWKKVKYYAQLVAQKIDQGVGMVQELLSTLTSDEKWGVMVEFEETCPDGFAQLVSVAPEWVVWMG
ncbi:hypothetical protein GS682_30815 [Nostoc sp. B(2019)]|nr:hypothetical protein [Nostoc sp. B(2019)]